MTQVKIIYPKRTQLGHFGGSGLTVGGGIAVWKNAEGELQLQPLGAKGRMSRSARLSIPADQVELVAAALISVKDA